MERVQVLSCLRTTFAGAAMACSPWQANAKNSAKTFLVHGQVTIIFVVSVCEPSSVAASFHY